VRHWLIRFDDGRSVAVAAEDVQDAIRAGHEAGGAKYTYGNIIEVRRQDGSPKK